MTPKQKQLKLAAIKQLITIANFKQDSYGNYKNQLNEVSYRIKLKSINIRIEHKAPESTNWNKIISQPIIAIDLEKLTAWLSKFKPTKEA